MTLGTLPDRLAATDLAGQGLPFYGGGVRYRVPAPAPLSGGRLMLELPAMSAACAKVSAPGRPQQVMAWRPFRSDVTDLAAGASELTVEVVLTRRNTFGPLHELPRRAPHYGPENFVTAGERWSDRPALFPAGLLASPEVVEVGVPTRPADGVGPSPVTDRRPARATVGAPAA